jgi:Uma2 family endonuclease
MATARITWREAQLMPENGKRYEAIDGELYVTPAPSRRHQRISGNLFRALSQILEGAGHGWVYHAPIGVEFPETEEGVQPDIIFVSKARSERLVREGIRGAPDLVIEILSPSTGERDRSIKKKLYGRQGVLQYWLVDPDTESIEVWDLESRGKPPARYVDHLPVTLFGRTLGELALSQLFSPEL